jgi:hypothetical protein
MGARLQYRKNGNGKLRPQDISVRQITLKRRGIYGDYTMLVMQGVRLPREYFQDSSLALAEVDGEIETHRERIEQGRKVWWNRK